ncbi:MAG TPA: bifunctional folylpolyglutamate synthase/dihydrofolate synthase [Lachnospiraceae bacterium]|nr:bifunctional folylpolyglutamate synthase/dihydrofolate synthase [Lachnospiraceae bacterium]
MNYSEALEYIDLIYGLGSDLGLKRVEVLMEKMGNPQENIKIIHVAGTNGKGSTCAMLSNILIEQGYRVGVYTSPHLKDYNERYTVNNVYISNDDFAKHMGIVKTSCDELVKEVIITQPTVFEVITALAFNYFAQQKVDYLILEVGLGGRFDATNIIRKPVLSIITSISMDHMEFLGNTLTSIAFEKGGIIKENCPVVLYTQGDEVYETEKAIAKERNAKLYFAKEQGITVLSQNIAGTIFDIENEYISYSKVRLGLLGDYQINNAATVLLACKALRDSGVELSKKSILAGLEKVKWSGRMEIVETDPIVILDGAHNIDGIHLLAQSLEHYFKNKKLTLLIGILGDKEYEKMIEMLLPLASKIVLTEPNNSRKWDIDTLTETIANFKIETYREKDIEKAYSLAKSITAKEDVLCCAGSLYLIGELCKFAGGKI